MNDPVDGGRKALDHWFGYPWYDAHADGVRRIKVSRPWNPDWRLPDLHFPASLLQWLAWIAIAVLLAAAVYLLVRAFWRRRGQAPSPKPGKREPIGGADRTQSLPVPLPRGRLNLLEEARRCYQRGDYGQAIIYFFSHQLVRLDKRKFIHLDRGKTNRQYLREVGSRATLGAMLEQTMTVFEDSYFGHRPIDRDRFETCWSRREEFDQAVDGGAL